MKEVLKYSAAALALCLATLAPVPVQTEMIRVYGSDANDANHPDAVDVAIVLAVDVSSSVKRHERRFQREAYAAALSDPAVQRMALGGRTGRVALAYLEWSGANSQRLHLPMEILSTPEDMTYFAQRIEGIDDTPGDALYVGSTAIGDALIAAEHAMRGLNVPAREFVIDISGDGIVNSGTNVPAVRDHLVSIGLTVNGLPIRISDDGWEADDNLPDRVAHFYETCVIGGSGSFHLVADGFPAVRETLIMKLMLEMADLEGPDRRRIAANWNGQTAHPLERVIPALVLQMPDQREAHPEARDCAHYERQASTPFEYP